VARRHIHRFSIAAFAQGKEEIEEHLNRFIDQAGSQRYLGRSAIGMDRHTCETIELKLQRFETAFKAEEGYKIDLAARWRQYMRSVYRAFLFPCPANRSRSVELQSLQ
jgi:hypothetical protein